MLGFGKNKKIDNNDIKAFDSAIKAIEIFISLSEWSKARKALNEVEDKEKDSLHIILEQDSEGLDDIEKAKLKQELKEKQNKIQKLHFELDEKEKLYNKDIDNERFKIRFSQIKKEITSLIGTKQVDAALELLKKFLEENANNASVVKFYNDEKKKLLKLKEKVDKETQDKITKNAQVEAMSLIGETVNINPEKKTKKEGKSFFGNLKKKFDFYQGIKERIKKKKLLDEINLLIEEDSKIKNDIAAKKIASIHKGLTKEIENELQGYELYGKLISTDKISGDTFGFKDNSSKYNFFLGDATGHGIRAGFIVTLLNRLFNQHSKGNDISKLTYEINNGLKQDLKSRNFITGVFFEIFKKDIGVIKCVGMGHLPIYIYRKETGKTEKIILGGLAAGVRLIKNTNDIKTKDVILNDGDVLLTYSDGLVENQNSKGEKYGFERLEKAFTEIAKVSKDVTKLYEYVINDIKIFKGSESFDDDASTIILKRDTKKDIVDNGSDYLEKIRGKEGLNRNEIRKLKGKSIEDIEKELLVLKKEKETERIIKILEGLYYTGELLNLKQEAIRYIKEGFIDKKINYYLKKAIDNEKVYKVKLKNDKAEMKYKILTELLKKGSYDNVIDELEKIISSDGEM